MNGKDGKLYAGCKRHYTALHGDSLSATFKKISNEENQSQ